MDFILDFEIINIIINYQPQNKNKTKRRTTKTNKKKG